MRQSELVTALKAAGYPVAFLRFKKPPGLPYVILRSDGTSNFFADNMVYTKAHNWSVYLATADKDLTAEQRLEDAMDAAGLCYDIEDETFLEDENVYQVMYKFEVQEG